MMAHCTGQGAGGQSSESNVSISQFDSKIAAFARRACDNTEDAVWCKVKLVQMIYQVFCDSVILLNAIEIDCVSME